jgi:hypothetical protein
MLLMWGLSGGLSDRPPDPLRVLNKINGTIVGAANAAALVFMRFAGEMKKTLNILKNKG